MDNTDKKLFLCIEDNEKFYMKAKDFEQANVYASYYNASVIKELPSNFNTNINPND